MPSYTIITVHTSSCLYVGHYCYVMHHHSNNFHFKAKEEGKQIIINNITSKWGGRIPLNKEEPNVGE